MIKKIQIIFLCLFPLIIFSQTYQEISGSLGINHYCDNRDLMGGGVALVDINNDGYDDIYLAGGKLQDKLYRNNGNGTFTNISLDAGLFITSDFQTLGVIANDFNNDGFKDILLLTNDGSYCVMLRNNGNETFSDISTEIGIENVSPYMTLAGSWGDYNKDGFIDLYLGNYMTIPRFLYDGAGNIIGYDHDCGINHLFLNNGDGTFTESASILGVGDMGCALATAFTDYDNDNDVDIYIANDFGEWLTPNQVYRNNYNTDDFTNMSVTSNLDAQMYGMGIAVGDYDQDQDLDYYVTNIGKNFFFRNNGDGTFTDVTTITNTDDTYNTPGEMSTGWGASFMDYDNDGVLDLAVANGQMPTFSFNETDNDSPSRLYKNNGDGTFTDVSLLEGLGSDKLERGLAYSDYDNDGDLDIFMGAVRSELSLPDVHDDSKTLIYKNNLSNSNTWLQVRLVGTKINRTASGSKVIIQGGGQTWMQELSGGGDTHASHNSATLHFGLGSLTEVTSISVVWTDGTSSVLHHVNTNQIVEIKQDGVEIDVLGNTLPIAHGDKVAFDFNHTDFGTVNIWNSESNSHTFTIENNGTESLTLSGSPLIEIIGADASDFWVTEMPTLNISAGSSSHFEITFSPTSEGIKTATVIIANNDVNEGNFSFTLRGKAENIITSLGNLLEDDFTIFPNPSQDVLYIKTGNHKGDISIQLQDLRGKVLTKQKLSFEENQGKIDVSNLNSGLYFIKIIEGEKVTVKKFIKQD